MRKNIVLVMFGIILGIVINAYCGISFEQKVFAKVAGMSDWDLRDDWDFRDAVTYIVQNRCKVSGERINCH